MEFIINIDKLVLSGFSKADAATINLMVTGHLARLINNRGWQPQKINAFVRHISAGSFIFNSQSSSRTIGRQIAQNIYNGLTPVGQKQSTVYNPNLPPSSKR